jgi:arylsulfatase A-like enzyme
MRRLRFVLILISVAVSLCCGSQEHGINLIIIGVDTLRPDHLGCYGYYRATSPHIDQLAANGVLFENVISQSPWTLPSFATVFTSLYPSQHGAISLKTRLRTTVPTLATILKENGYATAALINSAVMEPDFGVDRGFDYYDVVPRGERLADEITDLALHWIDRNLDDRFFLFIHYFDVHDPYAPPPPYDTLFDPDYSGVAGNALTRKRIGTLRADNFRALKYLTPADWNHIRALYDGEISFTDQAIRVLLDGIAERGLTERTLIVLLGDHGEEFYEHEGFGHGHTLYDEVLRVPLIFSLPGTLVEAHRYKPQVRLLDVLPTILDVLGFENPSHLEGTSLKSVLFGKGAPAEPGNRLLPSTVAYSEALYYGPEKKGLTAAPWKLIYDLHTRKSVLINLEDDPGELRNVADIQRDILGKLSALLLDTILKVSEAWYVRIGTDDHPRDYELRLRVLDQGDSRFSVFLLTDDHRQPVEAETEVEDQGRKLTVRFRSHGLNQALTLAVAVEPGGEPVEFDLRIDGRQAGTRTFVGSDLRQPGEMPFIAEPSPAGLARMFELARTLETPHLLVWQAKHRFSGQSHARLDESTGKALRALGYTQ